MISYVPRRRWRRIQLAGIGLLSICAAASCAAQDETSQSPSSPEPAITLDQAIALAKANEPTFAAAAAASRVSDLNRSIARSALLPSVTYHNQFVYTQPTSGQTAAASAAAPVRFIANNSVHEYTSQGVVSETIGLTQTTALARANAAAAVAHAELEIARRGLVTTVVGLYYGVTAASHKLDIAQRAAQEAASFTTLTQQRETARESAHADVVKAQLQQQQRERDLSDARLQADKARLELGVLLYADPRTPFAVTAPAIPAPLPSRDDTVAAANHLNPEIRSAEASLKASGLDVVAARAAYLPDLALSFNYGIDAPQFATRGPDGAHNLGYSGSATLDIPVWDWFTTQHKIRQAQINRDVAKVTLTAAQRKLIAQIEETYAEAATAQSQLQSLDLSVETARESLRLTRLRYTAGEATVLEVVDAQTSFTSAEVAREDGTTRYQTALANLHVLTGSI